MQYNPFSLEDKTILVTGASSGIGQSTAVECSKMGAKVIITARNPDRLQETFEMLHGIGHQQIVADLSNEVDIVNLVDRLPKLDGCVNNVGIVMTKPLPFYKREDVDRMFNTNTFSIVFIVQQLVKKKVLNRNSSIVITTSAGGVFGNTPGNGIYDMTKSALHSFMQTAALELAHKGIRCNSVNPAMVNTRMAEPSGSISEEQIQLDKKRYPLCRYGEPKDIALAIIYLLSDASSWVTGTALKIDGGRNLVR
ncbi:MAG: SDR family oxidoreductase [Bacteroidales bacterium]|nr:SDR family oxidoreductase [Bacteroidales bacterium]MBQ2913763.1 SDR family oxidoreductase [Bacteroidales bacterium]